MQWASFVNRHLGSVKGLNKRHYLNALLKIQNDPLPSWSRNRFILTSFLGDKSILLLTLLLCTSPYSGKLTQSVFGHWDVVTCLAYSRHVGLTGGDSLIASGSRDCTVLVWRWSTRLQRVVCAERSPGAFTVITFKTEFYF